MNSRNAGSRETVIRCEGVFDVPTARRLETRIECAASGEELRVDLTHVREFHDFGIAVLAQALKNRRTVRVVLQGLRNHQARMLRYFGVDPARFGLAAAERA